MSEARKMRIINPATEELITEIETDDSRSIIEKYNLAMSAQLEWERADLGEREAAFRRFKELLIEKKDLLARTLAEEVGKPIKQARSEIAATVGRVDFFLHNVRRFLGGETIQTRESSDDGRTEERLSYDPLGVIANISAWNYPYFVGVNVFCPALLTGNAVLYKPSEISALTGLSIAELLYESGIPDDVFIPIIGDAFAGQELLKWPVSGVFFTGSYRTGRAIADIVSRRFARLQLELGGKDPVYICDDVNIQQAATIAADGAFYNTGQSCCSVERIYVHGGIYDRFVEAFLAEVQSFKVGDPLDEETYIGPVAREAQIKILEAQVQDAVSQGARLALGGKRIDRKGYYFEPTVLLDVDHNMSVMREESFGPIIGVMRVKDDRQALQLMNDTRYGLTAGVFSNTEERAHAILSKVNAGSVYWNCCDRVSPRLPWSGRNDSGVGVTLGADGIRAFLRPRAWHLRTLS